jgi:hypothetical protein
MRRVRCTTSGSSHLSSVHFRLVSSFFSHVPLISGLDLVGVSSCLLTRSCSLNVTFSYVPRFVPACSSSLALPLRQVPCLVSTFSGSRSGCSACGSNFLCAFTLPPALGLIE